MLKCGDCEYHLVPTSKFFKIIIIHCEIFTEPEMVTSGQSGSYNST